MQRKFILFEFFILRKFRINPSRIAFSVKISFEVKYHSIYVLFVRECVWTKKRKRIERKENNKKKLCKTDQLKMRTNIKCNL